MNKNKNNKNKKDNNKKDNNSNSNDNNYINENEYYNSITENDILSDEDDKPSIAEVLNLSDEVVNKVISIDPYDGKLKGAMTKQDNPFDYKIEIPKVSGTE